MRWPGGHMGVRLESYELPVRLEKRHSHAIMDNTLPVLLPCDVLHALRGLGAERWRKSLLYPPDPDAYRDFW
eukprot:2806962-Prorocentrum_lima.AAC.1